MKIQFTFSRESLEKGARHHLMHRHRFITLLLPVMGIIFLIYGIHQMFFAGKAGAPFGIIPVALGIFYIFRFSIRTRSMVKNAFASNPDERVVTMEFSEEALTFHDGASTGSSPWSVFVDMKACKDGILLYPQKGIFYWIPDTASVEGGTWEDVTELVRKKIQPRV